MITVSTISGDNRILVGADYCGRAAQCLLNHNWTRLRIAMRLCVADSGADVGVTLPVTAQANFRVGLASGASLFSVAPPVPPAPTHAALFRLIGNNGIWFRQVGPPVSYLREFTAGELFVNGVQTTGSAGDIEASGHYLGATDANRTLMFCDFIRATPGAGTWTMNYFRNGDPSCVDVDQATFETQSLLVSPAVLNHVWAGGSTMAVSEATNGYFTHVNLFWNQAAPVIKISDLRVIVLTTL